MFLFYSVSTINHQVSSPIITRYLPCPHARCLSVGTQQSYPHRLLTMSSCTLLIGWYTAVLSSPVTYHVPMHVAYRLVHSSPIITRYLPCPHARCLSVGTQQSYPHRLLTMSPCTLLIGWYTAVLSSPVTYHVPMHVAYRLVHRIIRERSGLRDVPCLRHLGTDSAGGVDATRLRTRRLLEVEKRGGFNKDFDINNEFYRFVFS